MFLGHRQQRQRPPPRANLAHFRSSARTRPEQEGATSTRKSRRSPVAEERLRSASLRARVVVEQLSGARDREPTSRAPAPRVAPGEAQRTPRATEPCLLLSYPRISSVVAHLGSPRWRENARTSSSRANTELKLRARTIEVRTRLDSRAHACASTRRLTRAHEPNGGRARFSRRYL